MGFEVESLKKLKQATVKNINELGKKTDLTPAETKALVDGFELMDRLCYEIEDCEMKEENEKAQYSGYSGHGEMYAIPRRYSITSYARPRGSMRMSYGDGPYMEHGRSYTGPMAYQYDDPMYYGDGRGYSRHSIGDRAISCLEREMDTVGSDYERRELHRFIEMIRSAE